MLQNWQQRDHIAPNRVGIFGFSSGGFTALVNIGGAPDMAKVFNHCAAHPTQYACTLVDRDGAGSDQVPKAASGSMHDRRIRAAVIAAPALGFTFDAAALKKVRIPIQLWRAEDDMIVPHPWYAEQVRFRCPVYRTTMSWRRRATSIFSRPVQRSCQRLRHRSAPATRRSTAAHSTGTSTPASLPTSKILVVSLTQLCASKKPSS